MSAGAPPDRSIVLEGLSKFYGDVLGVNRVSLAFSPGVTSLVGPNGAGKTTLLHLITGLLRPTRGSVRVLGLTPDRPDLLLGHVGYCTQYDAFPPGLTGRGFLEAFLRVAGRSRREARALAAAALERVGMTAAADRKVAGYSKGMRQRVKLAQAIAHDPLVVLLDEPLNGLDPMARVDTMALVAELAARGRIVIVSSHILHEVEQMSERVVLLSGGYVVAEGSVRSVRGDMETVHPLQILVRCAAPEALASTLVRQDHVVAVRIHDDRCGLLATTRDADAFYALLGRLAAAGEVALETVIPADEDVFAVYQYLIGDDGGGA